ncbi:unnamed protein product [Aphanomyces euteiches]
MNVSVNNIDLLSRWLGNPLLLLCPSYGACALHDILFARIVRYRSIELPLIESNALVYISRYIGDLSGDAEMALNICRLAISKLPSKDPTLRVTAQDAVVAIATCLLAYRTHVVQSLPPSVQMVLLALLKCLESGQHTIKAVFKTYCSLEPSVVLSWNECRSALSALETNGVVDITDDGTFKLRLAREGAEEVVPNGGFFKRLVATNE